jgi:cysteinyl-tRNA synthetase
VLGLFGSEPAAWLEQQKLAALAELDITAEQIEQLIAARRQARQEKDFARADALRQELDAKGIELLDTPQGTSWKVK